MAIQPLYQAVHIQDWAAANAALPAAQAGAQSAGARYLVGQLILEIGRGTQNQQVQAQAVEAMLASGGAPANVVPQLLAAQLGFALQAQNYAAAEAPLTRLVELTPNDIERVTQLAQVKIRLNKRQEAYDLYRRVLQLSEAGGQHAAEPLYRQTLAIAYEARMVAPALELSRTLVAAYPTAENWRTALGVYRDLAGQESGAELDVGRLMRAAGALTSERDYFVYAEPPTARGHVRRGQGRARGRLRPQRHPANAAAERGRLDRGAAQRAASDRASLAGEPHHALAGSRRPRRPARRRCLLRLRPICGGRRALPGRAAKRRARMPNRSTSGSAPRWRWPASAPRRRRRSAPSPAPRAELAQLWLLWLSTHHA